MRFAALWRTVGEVLDDAPSSKEVCGFPWRGEAWFFRVGVSDEVVPDVVIPSSVVCDLFPGFE